MITMMNNATSDSVRQVCARTVAGAAPRTRLAVAG